MVTGTSYMEKRMEYHKKQIESLKDDLDYAKMNGDVNSARSICSTAAGLLNDITQSEIYQRVNSKFCKEAQKELQDVINESDMFLADMNEYIQEY